MRIGHISAFVRPFGAPRIHMDENASGGGDSGGSVADGYAASTIIRQAPADTSASLSIEQAARVLANARVQKRQQPAADTAVKAPEPKPAPAAEAEPDSTPAESAEDDMATAGDNELSVEDNDAPDENQAPVESEDTDAEADKLPPVPRPRSWAKEDQAEWESLPRPQQEKIAAREATREKAIRQAQNEAAEKSKALTAKEQAAEQARTQYESKLKSVLEVLENEQRRDFPDIKSQQDLDNIATEINRLATEAQRLWETDPLAAGQAQAKISQLQGKLAAWDIHQRKLVAAHDELKSAEQRKAKERNDAWAKHMQDQNALVIKAIPDLADETKGKALKERAIARLSDLGFTNEELNKLATGEEKISIFDHRFQQLVFSDLRLADLMAAKKVVTEKVQKAPVPPVVRPGAAPPRGDAASQRLQTLNKQLTKSGSLKDATALLLAKRAAASRSR